MNAQHENSASDESQEFDVQQSESPTPAADAGTTPTSTEQQETPASVPSEAAKPAPKTRKPRAPKVAVAQAAPEPEKLPTDLKAVIALVQAAENMPTRNRAEEAAKDARLKIVRQHFFDLQQGLPVIHVGGDSLAHVGRVISEESSMIHMRNLAMGNPVVAEFLNAFERLKAAYEAKTNASKAKK